MGKFVGLTLLGLVLLYALLCAGLYAAMRQPPERFGAIMSKVPEVAFLVLPFRPLWMVARAGHLGVGDAAPDFELPTVDRGRAQAPRCSRLRGAPSPSMRRPYSCNCRFSSSISSASEESVLTRFSIFRTACSTVV